jgi:hypothetical protein
VIRGFANFLKQKPAGYRAKLILFEYGMDVNASKVLIEELGIKNDVVWHQKASRKEIMALLSLADFTCGEFKPGCIGGNTTWEALVSGSCLLHYLNTTFTKFDGFLDEPYPFVNVNTPEDISQVFSSFVNEPGKYREIGSEGNKWYLKYFAGKSVDRYVELINAKQSIATKSIIAA